MNPTTIGLDIAKSSFQVHGIDASGHAVLRRKLPRGKVLAFFRTLPPATVGIEACAGAQHWARQIGVLGHQVRLLPPKTVKAYATRQKNDAIDAAAICEAASRPASRPVTVKTKEQQAALSLVRARDLLVRQRTALINALRGHLAEFGFVAARGRARLTELAGYLGHPELPQAAAVACRALLDQIEALDEQVLALEASLRCHQAKDAQARLLTTIPGIGLISAAALSLGTAPERYRCGREYAASLGLVPRQRSTGGRTKLGAISRMGDPRVRWLLVNGASAVLQRLCPRNGAPPAELARSAIGVWALRLLARKPKAVVVVALANKLARIAWSVLTRREPYRPEGHGRAVATAGQPA
jgi:transposase